MIYTKQKLHLYLEETRSIIVNSQHLYIHFFFKQNCKDFQHRDKYYAEKSDEGIKIFVPYISKFHIHLHKCGCMIKPVTRKDNLDEIRRLRDTLINKELKAKKY